MKQIFLLLAFFSKTVFAQTKIEGQLTAFSNTDYSIKTEQTSLNEYKGVTIGQGKTDDKGQFTVAIDIKTEQQVNLFIGNKFFKLWIKPNSTLTIKEEAGGRYTFSGAMASENSVLYLTGIMQPYKVSPNIGLNSFEPERQLHYLDSIETKRLLTLGEAEKTNTISKVFSAYCKTEVRNFSFCNKNQYPLLVKSAGKIKSTDIPKDYFSFWEKFRLEEDSTTSVSFQNALRDFIQYKTVEKIGTAQVGSENNWKENFRIADSLLVDHPFTLQQQKASNLLFLINYFNFTNFTAGQIDEFRNQFPLSSAIPIIESKWQKKQGAVSTYASFRLISDKGTWVDIKDFRGKVVYVDFWGSWCKACLLNMPYAKTLKEKFKNKDVVFLYLDFDDTNEKWKSAIEKYKIEGIHLKAEEADREYFTRAFNISQGFPRYALIDKSGKLVTISAPPPQEQSAYDLIKKYLDE